MPSVKLNCYFSSLGLHNFRKFGAQVTFAQYYFKISEFNSKKKLKRKVTCPIQKMQPINQVRHSAVVRQQLKLQLMYHVTEWIPYIGKTKLLLDYFALKYPRTFT